MKTQLDSVTLDAGQLWKTSARPCEIAIDCRRGSVWITQERDGRDFLLRAGERFVNSLRGRVVVQALTAALLRVTRRMVRPKWPVVVALPVMAGAMPLMRVYESTSPGIGVVMAVALGLLAYLLCEELSSWATETHGKQGRPDRRR